MQPKISPQANEKAVNKRALALTVATALIALVTGVVYYRNRQPSPAPVVVRQPAPEETAEPIPPVVPPPDRPAANPKTVTIYRVAPGKERARLVPTVVSVPPDEEPMAGALNAMAKTKDSPLPPGTRARSVRVRHGVAFVDFNDAFQKNFPGGDEQEAITINAVLGTLAHFFGVDRVQITVEGQKIDSLGGNQDLTEPLPVRESAQAISDGAARTAQNADP